MSTLLSINNIEKHYLKNNFIKKALQGVSFSLKQGEVFGLLGPNGAGKTTLSSIIATLHPPTSGDILWHQQSIYKHLQEYRSIIGFCPQKANLNPMLTLEDNLLFDGRFYQLNEKYIRHRAEYLMEKFNLTSYRNQNAEILSGGYKQRFLLARALMHNPQLLILDEPTVALDPHVRHQIWQYIKELKQEGITILLTTHYLDEAEILSDRVCILNEGLIKLLDTPENLKRAFNKTRLEDVFIEVINKNVTENRIEKTIYE